MLPLVLIVTKVGGVTGKIVAFVNVYITYDTPVACAFGDTMLYGIWIVSEKGGLRHKR